MMLHERYRPRDWCEFVGNEKIVKRVRSVLDREQFGGGAFWVSGPSGIGKTTLAHLICGQFVHDLYIEELDGDKCTVDAVRDLERALPTRPIVGDWKAVVVNEAHAMTSRAVQAWLTLLERLPPRRIVVFTTTEEAQEDLFGGFTQPLLSRCLHVPLSSYGLKEAFAERAKGIAAQEGLDGQPLPRYQRLVQECKNNLRAVLSQIEMGRMLEE